ncbi:MAG TPA: MFS transporter [Bauldia sp.]|nr:MFS transporter [Bauldia sp.]
MTAIDAAPAAAPDIRLARRNLFVLATASAVVGSVPSVAITLAGLAGSYLLGPDKSLATLPVTAMNLGVALGAIPAAAIMRRVGRRSGFMLGALIGTCGGLLAALAIFAGTFLGFTAALLVMGWAGAFTQQYRFAAGEGSSEALRAKAVSFVLAAGVASAVIGPQTVIFTHDLLLPTPFAGAFVAAGVLFLIGLAAVSFLGGAARLPPPVHAAAGGGRRLRVIVLQPRFLVAVLCAMSAYGLMSLVMTAAPLAMINCGLSESNAALGIQWHVIAMYAPSFVTGTLIARVGKAPVIVAGMVLLAGCGVAALSGLDILNFWVALVCLGVGWNFGFIGATALLAETYRVEERARIEGLNDALVFGIVALASLSSGSLLSFAGWNAVNLVIFPVVALALAALAFGGKRRQPA